MPTRHIIRNGKPTTVYKKKKRQRELTILWVLGVVFLAATLLWALDGTITNSPTTTLSLINQKVQHTLMPEVNELSTTAFVDEIENDSGVYDQIVQTPVFDNMALKTEAVDLAKSSGEDKVLAANMTADGREKWIEVDLSDQRLYAKEGESTVYNFLISSGLKWTPTPTGEFRVWIKLRYHTMIGGSKAKGDYYNLPNVPYVMYFYQGYGIHGAYWHNKFGTPRSHGCINVRPDEMAKIYEWAGPVMPAGASVVKSTPENPGIRIVIHQ